MKSFSFRTAQIVQIIAGLTADELARKHGRFTETLTLSRWTPETRLGRGGVGANETQQRDCAARAALFFELDAEDLPIRSGDTFGDWAERLLAQTKEGLTHFRFHPATPAGVVDSRHNADDIFQDAGAAASLMQGRRRVVSLVSAHSLIGLVTTVLAPNLLDLEVIDGRSLNPDELGERVTFGDILIATPTLWRYLAETLPALANNVMGLSFGERLGPDLASRLRQRGLGAIRELYGSTETGLVAWRDSAPDPFVLFDHWSHSDGSLVRERPNGQRRKMLPMDDLQWQGQRSFQIGARRDGAVQIGGMNVFPSHIAHTIEAHPDVSECTVWVSQRSGALDRLIADIHLSAGRAGDQAMAWSIDEWCRERLRPTERPRIMTFFETAEKG